MTKPKITFPFFIVAVMIFESCNLQSTSADGLKRKSPPCPNPTKYDSTKFEKAFRRLCSGDTLSQTQIDSFARTPDTRADFYELLVECDRQDLFPREYLSFEKAAESRLVNWLQYPTELDSIPSKIELLKRVEYLKNDTTFIYYVYRFKTDPPQWAAKDGWMVGVVGPYFLSSHPYDWTKATFSKFSKIGETTPLAEVEWVHKNIYERKPD